MQKTEQALRTADRTQFSTLTAVMAAASLKDAAEFLAVQSSTLERGVGMQRSQINDPRIARPRIPPRGHAGKLTLVSRRYTLKQHPKQAILSRDRETGAPFQDEVS